VRLRVVVWLAAASCGSSASPPDARLPDAAPDTAASDTVAACIEKASGAWAAWPLPNPAGTPAQSYDTSTPGVAVDRVTGLSWQRAILPDNLDWQQAKLACSCLVLGGHDDWRLPSRIELVSLVDFTRQEPALDPVVFPDTPHEWFWSSSVVAGTDPPAAWYVAFFDGDTHYAGLEVPYRVRCVRGAIATAPRFTARPDGTVADATTGLTWQKSITSGRTWAEAKTTCAALPGWRLPDMKELQTIIDEHRSDPAVDPALFPDTPDEGFWAATPLAGTTDAAWFVSFAAGIAYNSRVDHLYNVRCVR
jgi:hypothetical protein